MSGSLCFGFEDLSPHANEDQCATAQKGMTAVNIHQEKNRS